MFKCSTICRQHLRWTQWAQRSLDFSTWLHAKPHAKHESPCCLVCPAPELIAVPWLPEFGSDLSLEPVSCMQRHQLQRNHIWSVVWMWASHFGGGPALSVCFGDTAAHYSNVSLQSSLTLWCISPENSRHSSICSLNHSTWLASLVWRLLHDNDL